MNKQNLITLKNKACNVETAFWEFFENLQVNRSSESYFFPYILFWKFFIHSPVDRHPDYSQFGAIMNVSVQVFLWI